MSIQDIIQSTIDRLPEDRQLEVLVFLNSLMEGQREDNDRLENLDWSNFSLSQAMQGLEDDNIPEYTEQDIKEKW